MSELRVGGLAIIVNSQLKENIGRTVILKEYLGVIIGYVQKIERAAWHVESATSEVLKGILPDGEIINTMTCAVPSDWLMPIDGEDFSHEDERQKELTNG
ncbi:hypothetical protein [Enterobacter oligotrophicus]|uniref:hypothetical protein n=1 Tax=Enterobacter oligotrophicus TaxID=2478464 RepID=UPI0028ACAA1D|nr:hypothetical protein [Enterobacter oligotrophicus]